MKTTLLLLALLIPLGSVLTVVWWSWKNGISPTPTTRKQFQAILKLIPEPVCGTILELGSGWGTLAFSLAKAFPGQKVIGYETSPVPYLISRFLKIRHTANLEFRRANFLYASLPESYLIVCYLFPGGMKKLQQKLQEEPGGCVWLISNTFALPGEKPSRVIYCDDVYRSPVYLYRIGKTMKNRSENKQGPEPFME